MASENIRINNYVSNICDENLSNISDSEFSFRSEDNSTDNSQYNQNDIESNFLESSKICIICNDEIKDLCILRCKHSFCLQCFMNWFKNNKTCPFCRKNINIDIFASDNDQLNRELLEFVDILQTENNRLGEINSINSTYRYLNSCKVITYSSLFSGLFISLFIYLHQ